MKKTLDQFISTISGNYNNPSQMKTCFAETLQFFKAALLEFMEIRIPKTTTGGLAVPSTTQPTSTTATPSMQSGGKNGQKQTEVKQKKPVESIIYKVFALGQSKEMVHYFSTTMLQHIRLFLFVLKKSPEIEVKSTSLPLEDPIAFQALKKGMPEVKWYEFLKAEEEKEREKERQKERELNAKIEADKVRMETLFKFAILV